MLQQNAGLEEGLGGIQWELAGCLLLAWICVYLIIWKGLHSSGKVKFLLLMFKLDINKVTFLPNPSLIHVAMIGYSTIHSMARAYLKKVENFMTNTMYVHQLLLFK